MTYMKNRSAYYFILLSVSAVTLLVPACKSNSASQENKTELTTTSEKLSYALGLDIGASIKENHPGVDLQLLMQGIEDRLNGNAPLLTAEQAAAVKKEFLQMMHEKRLKRLKEVAEKNLREGKAFLAENGEKPGVITTASGLQYEVLEDASGPRPTLNDRVKVHYRGYLLDGTEFDSSYKRNQPAVFPVNDVIPGWKEALQLMPVGSTFKLFIPPQLAYGEQSAGPYIGPNATVIYEIHLLGIEH